MEWSSHPITLHKIGNDIDYILAIDENGIPSLKNLINPKNDLLQWFTITGVMFSKNSFTSFIEDIAIIKNRYWENGLFNNKKVVFHSRDIRKKLGAFNPKIIDYDNFISDINSLIKDNKYNIFSSSIDKFSHVRTYSTPYPVYDLCLEFLLERYCYHLNSNKSNGIIVVESRGKCENKLLLNSACKILENGNRYNNSSFFSRVKGIYFNPKRTLDKKKSFPMLELADLVSYPIHKYIKDKEKNNIFKLIEDKFYNYPNYYGYGLKTFPNKIVRSL